MPPHHTVRPHPPRILGATAPGGLVRADPGGDAAALQWLRDGVALPGATEPVLRLPPDAADYDLGLRIDRPGQPARFAPARRVRPAPPQRAEALWDEVLDRGDGAVPLDAARAFRGLGLRFSVQGAPGVLIDPETGRLTLNADLPLAEQTITVIARNSAGSVRARFRLTLEEEPGAVAPDALLPGMWQLDPADEEGALQVRFPVPPVTATPDAYRIDGGRAQPLPPDGRIAPLEAGLLHRVSLRDPGGFWSEERAALAEPARTAPDFSEPPELPARAVPGAVLRARCGLCSGEPVPELSYLWFRDDLPLPGETGPYYRLRPADTGRRIGVRVIAQNASGEARAAAETRVADENDSAAGWQSDFADPADLDYWRTTHREVIVELADGAMRVRAVAAVPGNAKTYAYLDLLVTPGATYRLRVSGRAKTSRATWRVLAGTPADPETNATLGRSGGRPKIEIDDTLTMGARQNLLRLSLRGGTFADRGFDYAAVSLTPLDRGATPQPVPAEGGTATLVTEAATYYIDPEGGDDAADGRSPQAAWKSYPAAILPGTTLVQKGGTRHRGPIHVTGGRADARVILDGNSDGAWGQGRAILDGGRILNGWAPAGEGLYRTDWPAHARAPDQPIYQEDVFLPCAQLPAPSDPFRPRQPQDFALANAMSATTITAKTWFETRFRDPETLAQGAFVRVWGQGNAVHTLPVVAFDRDAGQLTFDNPKGVFKPYDQPDRLRFAVVNHPDCLRQPGQWVRSPDGASLILRPLGDVDPTEARIDYAALSGGIRCTGSHVTVRHMRITKLVGGSAIKAEERAQTGVTIEGCRIDTSSVYAGVLVQGNTGARVVDNELADVALGRGIFLSGCRDSLVRGNRSNHIGGTQISLYGCRDCAVLGNAIGRRAKPHSNGMSFYMGNARVVVAGNTVRMGSGAGLVMQDSRGPNTVVFNDIVTRSGYSVAFWRSARRIADPQGGHLVANNTILSRTDNRAFLFQSPTERAGSFYVNNIVDGTNAGWDIRHDPREAIHGVALIDGGAGYARGDRISPVAGSGNPAVIQVLAVDANGAITDFNKRSPGAYTRLPEPLSDMAFRGEEGRGRGARFRLTAGPAALRLNTANLITQFRQDYGLTLAQHRQLGNFAMPPPQRTRFLRVITAETAPAGWDPRPVPDPPPVFAAGSGWELRLDPGLVPGFPTGGLEIGHVGRYLPDGSDVFDWVAERA